MPKGIQDSSRREFIKKEKDSSSTERCKCIEARKKSRECIKMTKIIKLGNTRSAKGPKKFIQSRDERPKKKKREKERKKEKEKKRKEAH